jgi:hypothetical protein
MSNKTNALTDVTPAYLFNIEAVVVLIVWYLVLQLPVQSVPITTNVMSLNPVHDKVYSINIMW